tara:strand:- start:411 stop:590 length:180 start_codon:yes stop_codon:yes gene_type:complete
MRPRVVLLFGLTPMKSLPEAHTKLMCEIEDSRISMVDIIQPSLCKRIVLGEDDQTDHKK